MDMAVTMDMAVAVGMAEDTVADRDWATATRRRLTLRARVDRPRGMAGLAMDKRSGTTLLVACGAT
jgi:hypothetical protein